MPTAFRVLAAAAASLRLLPRRQIAACEEKPQEPATSSAVSSRHAFEKAARESAESAVGHGLAAFGHRKLFKPDRYQVEKDRHVVVLVGLTGSGKSSTGNTLCGARRAFVQGASVASVTSAVSVRDYEFEGGKWRVVDTPGFGDTHVSPEVIDRELGELFKYAKHGITCILVVVRKTRFTAEQEATVLQILELFGGQAALPFCIMAITGSTEPREKLLDDIGRLPPDHALRRMAVLVNDRVLPVENIKEGARLVSRLLLHNGALEVLEMNGGPFKPEPPQAASAGRLLPTEELSKLQLKRCESTWDSSRRRLTTVCDFE